MLVRKRRESNPQNPVPEFMDFKSSGLADAQRFRVTFISQYHAITSSGKWLIAENQGLVKNSSIPYLAKPLSGTLLPESALALLKRQSI